MNDINSRAGSAIDLKLSNTQTFNLMKKKKGAGALARGTFKVKVFECEFLNFSLGLFKVAPQLDWEVY